MRFKNVQPQDFLRRAEWRDPPQTPRHFIRGWIIPITRDMEEDFLKKMKSIEGAMKIDFDAQPTTHPLTQGEFGRIGYLG